MAVCASHSPTMRVDTADRHGLGFRSGLGEARRIIERFDPQLVVIFGSDHRRAFVDTVPAFSVIAGGQGWGDYGSPEEPFSIASNLAAELAADLLDHDFDVAFTRSARLDHGFSLTLLDLLGGIDTEALLPIFVNCATPPLPGATRTGRLGARVGCWLSTRDERILYLGSGGLSHSPPSLLQPTTQVLSEGERLELNRERRQHAAESIDEHWDRGFLERLGTDDARWLEGFDQSAIDRGGIGANEVRTWIATRNALDAPLRTLAYEPVPEWITGMAVAIGATNPRTSVGW
ncbi:MAG: 3-carboxyethylcatechol 2,3-dioxygenase [Ilumatobacteraceae bacterium]